MVPGVVCSARYPHALHKVYVADVELKVAGLRRDIGHVEKGVREITGENEGTYFEKYCQWNSRGFGRGRTGLYAVDLEAMIGAVI